MGSRSNFGLGWLDPFGGPLCGFASSHVRGSYWKEDTLQEVYPEQTNPQADLEAGVLPASPVRLLQLSEEL